MLVVDASQGVQAQTVANAYLAIEDDLEIVPVLNKIDLPSADPDAVTAEIERTWSARAGRASLRISAKTGHRRRRRCCRRSSTASRRPRAIPQAPLRALIFDSYYDPYRGWSSTCAWWTARFTPGDRIGLMHSGTQFDLEEMGVFSPGMRPAKHLAAGEVGYS